MGATMKIKILNNIHMMINMKKTMRSCSMYDSCEWPQDNNEQYAFDYCDVEGPGEEQMQQQIAESLKMKAEINSEEHIMDPDNYVEEDQDLFGVEEALEKDQ
jgi:hypothetical protein